jgi:hypothetical protein
MRSPNRYVFHAFTDQFQKLSEDDFVSLWCIYLVSLAHEQFIKSDRYRDLLEPATAEINAFRRACADAKIPEIQARKSLRDVLEWSLGVLASWRPKLTFRPPHDAGEFELDLFGRRPPENSAKDDDTAQHSLPKYVNEIKVGLEAVLGATRLSLWLMVDRLDEIFPRRSNVERTALRGLLRAMRYFASESIRVKVFLRDDMLDQVVRGEEGFTALTHVTVRRADTLRWTQDQILAMVVKRFFADEELSQYLGVNRTQLEASPTYREQCFNKIFPPTVYKGPKQSPTIRWICNRCANGRGVVTPRDVLDLLISAKQKQQDTCAADPDGETDYVIGASAIQYGFQELSERKRQTYLQAEFPHLWPEIEKFQGGKTYYSASSLQGLLGPTWKSTAEHLLAIGFLSKSGKASEEVYSIPFLYRHGMSLTQGTA